MNGQGKTQEIIRESIEASVRSKRKLLDHVDLIAALSRHFIETLQRGNTIFLFGNGGSAADAQHIAAELVGRFALDRKSLSAVALTVNTSNLTAIANDYGYDFVFSRQLEGLLRKGDLVVALSTSGNSSSVLEGVRVAKEKGCMTIGFTGEPGGKLKNAVDLCFEAPAAQTARIQEIHMFVGHMVCEIVELEHRSHAHDRRI